MRILFCTDFHGNRILIRKARNFYEKYRSDLMLVGGDIASTHFIPIIETEKFYFVSRFKIKLRNYENALELSERLSKTGYITWIGNYDELKKLDVYNYCLKKQKESIEFFINTMNDINIFTILGNDDNKNLEKLLGDLNVNGRIVNFGEIEVCGMSYINPTPFKTEFEVSEEELEKKIKEISNCKDVWLFHAPPFNSGLDRCVVLNKNLSVKRDKNGFPVYENVGSKSVRKCIEEFSPKLMLCGHIHESCGIVKIGKTLCINPGSDPKSLLLRIVIIDIKDTKIKNVEMLTL